MRLLDWIFDLADRIWPSYVIIDCFTNDVLACDLSKRMADVTMEMMIESDWNAAVSLVARRPPRLLRVVNKRDLEAVMLSNARIMSMQTWRTPTVERSQEGVSRETDSDG